MASTILDLYRNELARPRPDHYTHVAVTGSRTFSTQEFFSATAALASALAELGVSKGDRVVLLSDNRPEWHQVDVATLSLGAVDVPVYPTLASGSVAYHVEDSGAVVVITENARQTAKLLKRRDAMLLVRAMIQIEGECGDGVTAFDELINRHGGTAAEETFWQRAEAVAADDLASLVYTSGTTAKPKGVMLTHGNFTSNVEAVLPRVPLSGEDQALEFLPLCHVFERTCGYAYMHRGVSRTYCAPAMVSDNIRAIAPTAFASVPRLYEKIHATIMAKVNSAPAVRKRMFHWAVATGRKVAALRIDGKPVPAGLGLRHRLADALVLSKIRAFFGGRVRFALSGGAPLSPTINEFFHAIGIPIQEGYGLTETSPGIAVAGFQPGENRIGSVGKPLHNIEIKLADDGELLVRGPSITRGYWNKPEATAEAFDADGFFCTGDIARLDRDGFLFITDRKKDIIIPAGGKNVAPQPIENELKNAPFIDNVVLIGDRKPYIVALISPAEEEIRAWAANCGLGGVELGELLREPHIKRSIEKAISTVNADLGHFEQIKKFRVLPRPLTMEDGDLTPTLKVKRRVVEKAFADLLEEMYLED